jgi:hypothetical protein
VALTSGGGQSRLSKPEYEQSLRAVYADVQASFQSTRVVSSGDLADRLEAAQTELLEAADQLERAKPPTDVYAENTELAEGMREYATDLDDVRNAADRRDRAAVARFNEELAANQAVERMAEAAEEMKFKGYDLGPIAEE